METKKPDPPKVDGPIYRLRSQHVLPDGRLLEAGTLVGAGQDNPWPQPPTNQMEGVNDAGKAEVNKVHQRLYGVDAPWHDPAIARSVEEDLKMQEQQRREVEQAHPVSHQQAVEQDKEWKGRPDPVVQARVAGTAPPPPQVISGALGGPGVAVPKTEPELPKP